MDWLKLKSEELEPKEFWEITPDLVEASRSIDLKKVWRPEDVMAVKERIGKPSEMFLVARRREVRDLTSVAVVNDLDRPLETVVEVMAFTLRLILENVSVFYLMTLRDTAKKEVVFKAAEVLPLRRVFFWSDTSEVYREVFERWLTRDYTISQIEPFVSILRAKREKSQPWLKVWKEGTESLGFDTAPLSRALKDLLSLAGKYKLHELSFSAYVALKTA